MQAEGIKAGDQGDGWEATQDAIVKYGRVFVPVLRNGALDTDIYDVGQQASLTWDAGGDLQRTVKYPPGPPEYDAYRAELTAELEKLRNGEPPYDTPDFVCTCRDDVRTCIVHR